MSKILIFIVLFLALIGVINGIGYSCYIGQYPTAVGVAALTFLAWPTAKEYFNRLLFDKGKEK